MRRLLVPVLLLALALPGCGDDDDGGAAAPPTKPKVEIPAGPAPATLKIDDITVGSGAEAVDGKQLTMHYVGVLHKNGVQFDASWDRSEPFPFRLGVDSVIQGWHQGIKGMKVGGRRRLIIPPDLAYGDTGQGDIGPNETLVFVVDLVAVTD